MSNNVEFLNIGSCGLHKIDNAFRKSLSCLANFLNQFACDVYFFLNSRREDYASLEELTEVASTYSMKHSSTK